MRFMQPSYGAYIYPGVPRNGAGWSRLGSKVGSPQPMDEILLTTSGELKKTNNIHNRKCAIISHTERNLFNGTSLRPDDKRRRGRYASVSVELQNDVQPATQVVWPATRWLLSRPFDFMFNGDSCQAPLSRSKVSDCFDRPLVCLSNFLHPRPLRH